MTKKPKFELLKLNLDTRPKNLTGFGVLPFGLASKDREIVLMFGGEANQVRYTFLFDPLKREICKCNIYTGDQDRFMTN